MQNFEYASPKSVKEATALLGNSWADAAVLAGGTDLISLMKDQVASPKRVVNIKDVKELGGISQQGAMLVIGATATFDDLLANAAVRSHFPALVQAARGVASPQIRNMGTAGGDLCQRPRCWYFRAGHGILGKSNGESLVPGGQNEYHAIFPEGAAYFVNPSSLAPALIALGAQLTLVSAAGTRTIGAEKFFVVPQSEDAREIALQPNEILTAIRVPMTSVKNATYEVRQKEALDWPLATASVALIMDHQSVKSARIVLGHVAPVPHPCLEAEQAIAGKTIDEASAEAAGQAAVRAAKPLSNNAYKVQLAKVAVKRALLQAAGKMG